MGLLNRNLWDTQKERERGGGRGKGRAGAHKCASCVSLNCFLLLLLCDLWSLSKYSLHETNMSSKCDSAMLVCIVVVVVGAAWTLFRNQNNNFNCICYDLLVFSVDLFQAFLFLTRHVVLIAAIKLYCRFENYKSFDIYGAHLFMEANEFISRPFCDTCQ